MKALAKIPSGDVEQQESLKAVVALYICVLIFANYPVTKPISKLRNILQSAQTLTRVSKELERYPNRDPHRSTTAHSSQI